ncbi:MAG: DoxX family protein [Bacteroidota bacterium]|nr:DoxX family protein [Bacteroidota bacterium]
MKILANICRILVGGLFIFSGVIKLNDPVGTQIKLTEYFEVFGEQFHIFIPYTLYLSVFVCALEVILGVAILLYYRMKLTAWPLLGLIVFFTFLTFYSAFFNKVTDCGCFGDFLKLKPWHSFWKDIVLTVLILPLFFMRNQLSAGFDNKLGDILIGITTFISICFAVYCIMFLSVWDFRAYKVGNNIPALMKPACPPVYQYIMTRGNEQKTFDKYPTDTTWQFKEMVLTNPDCASPKITDYSVWNDEGDYTQKTFEGKKLLIVLLNTDKANTSHWPKINELIASLNGTGVEPIVITSSDRDSYEDFRHKYSIAAPYYFADAVVIKTMIRSIPGIMYLQDGTVKGKWSHNAVPSKDEILKL